MRGRGGTEGVRDYVDVMQFAAGKRDAAGMCGERERYCVPPNTRRTEYKVRSVLPGRKRKRYQALKEEISCLCLAGGGCHERCMRTRASRPLWLSSLVVMSLRCPWGGEVACGAEAEASIELLWLMRRKPLCIVRWAWLVGQVSSCAFPTRSRSSDLKLSETSSVRRTEPLYQQWLFGMST